MALQITRCIFFIAILLTLSSSAHALNALTGPVIFAVSGAINVDYSDCGIEEDAEHTNIVQFDLAMLENIGLTKLTTNTPWTTGLINFEGVLARDLLKYVGAQGTSIKASALDGYTVYIPIEDFLADDVIIATRIEGQAIEVRDNGPLWVIYPWTKNSKLKRPHYIARSIWQLRSFIVGE